MIRLISFHIIPVIFRRPAKVAARRHRIKNIKVPFLSGRQNNLRLKHYGNHFKTYRRHHSLFFEIEIGFVVLYRNREKTIAAVFDRKSEVGQLTLRTTEAMIQLPAG
jgi:hypothetical protein